MDNPALESWTGRTMSDTDIVTPRLDAEYRATFDPTLAPVAEGDAALGLHWCLSPAISPASGLGHDGHPRKGGFLPPVPLPRRMWAGGEIETRGVLRVGDTVTRHSRIGDISHKSGRTGALCFVAVHHDYATARGVVISERHDIVYREAATAGGGPAKAVTTEHRAADLVWQVDTTPVLLFRYSAMTFNGHRIHYDPVYATEQEGYDGLVVHGPIQATLMLNLAATLLGRTPARFRYRGLSPLVAGSPVTVSGLRDGAGRIECWTTAADGRRCMEAVATAEA